MTALLMNGLDDLVDDVAAAQTVELATAVEGAMVKALQAELHDHEIEELIAAVTAELAATYLTVSARQGTRADQPPSFPCPQPSRTDAHPNEGVHQ